MIVDAFAKALGYGLNSMPVNFLLVDCFSTPVLDHRILWGLQQPDISGHCLEPLGLTQKVLVMLLLVQAVKYLEGRLRVVCAHVWGFFWLFLALFLVDLTPFLRFSLHFTVWGLCLCTDLLLDEKILVGYSYLRPGLDLTRLELRPSKWSCREVGVSFEPGLSFIFIVVWGFLLCCRTLVRGICFFSVPLLSRRCRSSCRQCFFSVFPFRAITFLSCMYQDLDRICGH